MTIPEPSMPTTIARYSVSLRDWGGHKKLDLTTDPGSYVTWRDRALTFLARERPDVLGLLEKAERREAVITLEAEQSMASEAGVTDPIYMSYVLFGAIKHILTDGLLNRARAAGEGRGFELWRLLLAR